jgi:GntR family transcriptional regulator, transcriptional repressor for pyruvate dehydrogenase complex
VPQCSWSPGDLKGGGAGPAARREDDMSGVLTNGSFRRDRTSAADQVAEDLRLQILSGGLERGTRLPSEKEMAAHYDVSSATVREALRALSAMSLIEVRHGSGTFVTAETSRLLSGAMAAVVQLERVDLFSILDVSEALYRKAVRLAADHATGADIRALRAAADRLDSRAKDRDLSGPLEVFLKALVNLSHNPLLISLCSFLIDTQIAQAQAIARRSPAVWRKIAGELIAEREAVVDAVEHRDSDAAERAVSVYVARAMELVRAHAGAPAESGRQKSSGHLLS